MCRFCLSNLSFISFLFVLIPISKVSGRCISIKHKVLDGAFMSNFMTSCLALAGVEIETKKV